MRKTVALGLSVALIAFLASCGRAGTSTEPDAGGGTVETVNLDGEWQVNGEITGNTLTPEEAEVFEKAAGDLGFEPVALIGKQLVSGMNYAYLCKEDGAGSAWDVAVIYQDLSGDARFVGANRIDLANVKTRPAKTDLTTGAWKVPAANDGLSLPGEADAFFDEAMVKLSEGEGGYALAPQALLGTQVVAGTNYLVLCLGTPLGTTEDLWNAYLLTMYQDLDGNVEVTSIDALDVAYYASPIEVID